MNKNENNVKKRKANRRGGRKSMSSSSINMKIIHSNCDGLRSKKESVKEILEVEASDVLLLNVTALKGNRKVKIPKYFSYSKNREKAKGRVETVVKDNLKNNTIKEDEGRDGDEYIITRYDHVNPALNIVNIYGEQEGRSTKESIEKSWLRLYNDIKTIAERGENVMIIGDLNRAVGNDEWGIKGNNRKVSKGGEFLREMIKSGGFTFLNNMDKSDKGPWTWIDRKDKTLRVV